nr:hypothetical protein [uncultured Roseateles sp.]
MKTKTIKAFASVATLAFAGLMTPAHAVSNNGLYDVLSINLHDSGHAIVNLSGADNTEGCSTPGNRTQILIDKADPRFKTMYATLLFAMGSGKKVAAWVSGCQDVWGDGSMKVPYVRTLSVER